MTLDLKPFYAARDRLLDKIDEVGLDDQGVAEAKKEIAKFIVEGGVIQAARRGDDPERFVRENAILAIQSLRTDSYVAGDPVSNAIETLKRALGLPPGY